MASGSRRSRMIAANVPVVAVQRLGGAGRRHDAVVVELEDVAEVGARVGIVLDHQDVDRRRIVHGRQRGASPCPPPPRISARRSRAMSRAGTSNGL